MVNSKSKDFALYKMMQEFKNGLLHHFLERYKLEYFDFGIINNSILCLGNQRPIIFDNANECLPIAFLQNQKMNLVLFANEYFNEDFNGIITKTHYVNRDVTLNESVTGSYEFLEMCIKYNLINENQEEFHVLTSMILNNIVFYLNKFKNNYETNFKFRIFKSSPNYLFNKINNFNSDELSILNFNSSFQSYLLKEFDWVFDDISQTNLVTFFDKKDLNQLDLMYITTLASAEKRKKEYIEKSQPNVDIDEIVEKLNNIVDKNRNFIYIKLNLTNLIYYFFDSENINQVECSYLTKKIKTKYKNKNILYKSNF